MSLQHEKASCCCSFFYNMTLSSYTLFLRMTFCKNPTSLKNGTELFFL